MGPILRKYLITAGMAGAVSLATSVAYAEGEKIGDTQSCVRLIEIDSTPVINDSTILLKMRRRDNFKRVDMVAPCFGLSIEGSFAHKSYTETLCTTDQLRALAPGGGGEQCMIKQIVTISPDEAKTLLASKKGP